MEKDINKLNVQKIVPFLSYDSDAEEAVNFYVSLFKNSKIIETTKYLKESEEVSWKKAWTIMTIDFELEWQKFSAINWWSFFKFSSAISFIVYCETQEEIDHFWKNFSAWGKEIQCGWIEDKYGLTWQIVPPILDEFLRDKDTVKAWRVMEAMLKMIKIDIEELKKAYKG